MSSATAAVPSPSPRPAAGPGPGPLTTGATTGPAGGAAGVDGATPDVPWAGGFWCAELELSGTGAPRGVVAIDPAQHSARVLVRLHGSPLGYLRAEIRDGAVATSPLVGAAWAQFGDRIDAHLEAEGLPARGAGTSADAGFRPATASPSCPDRIEPGPTVSVVVCTRNRGPELSSCLDGLATATYPGIEFVIVDNAPSDETTRTIVEAVAATDGRFRYVREPRPGLSCARNKGLAEAAHTFLAYTDDDVEVDPDWVDGLLRGFARRPDVGCVTGLACTASVTTEAEAYFDARASSWSTRFEPEIFDMGANRRDDALYPYSAGIFGTGANFAFRRQLVIDLGGFDEALGAGTRTRGGEDLDIFVRILLAGKAIAYEPSSIVWHHHRADTAGLLKQMFGYGTGSAALIVKLLANRSTRGDVLRRIPRGVLRMARIGSDTSTRLGEARAPKGALARELSGYLAGPVLYARARRAARAAHL